MYWLRRVAYDRVKKNYRTVSTYFLSATWHGFFLGYYLTFATGALVTVGARMVWVFTLFNKILVNKDIGSEVYSTLFPVEYVFEETLRCDHIFCHKSCFNVHHLWVLKTLIW